MCETILDVEVAEPAPGRTWVGWLMCTLALFPTRQLRATPKTLWPTAWLALCTNSLFGDSAFLGSWHRALCKPSVVSCSWFGLCITCCLVIVPLIAFTLNSRLCGQGLSLRQHSPTELRLDHCKQHAAQSSGEEALVVCVCEATALAFIALEVSWFLMACITDSCYQPQVSCEGVLR